MGTPTFTMHPLPAGAESAPACTTTHATPTEDAPAVIPSCSEPGADPWALLVEARRQRDEAERRLAAAREVIGDAPRGPAVREGESVRQWRDLECMLRTIADGLVCDRCRTKFERIVREITRERIDAEENRW